MNMLRFSKYFLTSSFAAASALMVLPSPPEPQISVNSPLYFLPSRIESLARFRPRLKNEIHTSYQYLRKTCPALNAVDLKDTWNVADWMKKHISKEEWAASPYSFRMNSYKAISVQKNTSTKTDVLTTLSDTIPYHPDFIIWLDNGRAALKDTIEKDPYLNEKRKNWNKIWKNDEEMKAYANRVGQVIFSVYLPDMINQIPGIAIRRDSEGLERVRGYIMNNQVALNFSENGASLKTWQQVDRTTSHEFFHIIHGLLGAMARSGKLDHNPALKDAGIKYIYSADPGLAQIPSQKDIKGYRASFHERAAFYVASVFDDKPFFLSRDENGTKRAPVSEFGRFSEEGILPSACLK